MTFEDFYRAPGAGELQNDYSELDWLQMYNHYTGSFGEDNVFALPYELMRFDLDNFICRLQNFIGSSVGLGEYFFKVKENVSFQTYTHLSAMGDN